LKTFKTYDELKKQFADMHVGIKTDVEIISGMFEKLNTTKTNLEEKLLILEDLEFYLHQVHRLTRV